jgi:NAD(P)-dependent dehydrogenase (short-subunit alcohol dehydrogenase family)
MTNAERLDDSIRPFNYVIIGGSGGIGRHLVKSLSKKGSIIGTFCSSAPPEYVENARYFRLDIRNSADVNLFFNEHCSNLERLVVIYTPGISANAMIHKINDDDWEDIININLTGAMRVTRSAIKIMKEKQFGRIIYLSSVLSHTAVPGTSAYSASKAGLEALARVVSIENASKNISANSIALGYFSVGIIESVPKDFLDSQVIPKIPKKSLGDPDEIVNAINFIAKSEYMVGATIKLNGGLA